MDDTDRTLDVCVPELCLAFPDVEQVASHGMSRFVVAGKTICYYARNHHGDNRLALWLNMPEGMREMYLDSQYEGYFIPPYVGKSGYLGIELNKDIPWEMIVFHVKHSYEFLAPKDLYDEIPEPEVRGPQRDLRPEEIDPINSVVAQETLQRVRDICFSLPEVSEVPRFGKPAFLAGKKTFASFAADVEKCWIEVWVGVERQLDLVNTGEYHVPRYTGHNGWILRYVNSHTPKSELQETLLFSYRHFALKRMLKEMPDMVE